MLVIKKSFIL